MNHVSIFEKKWLDLVFEGKNKSYGAYQLRLQNPRTTIIALFFGIAFLGSAIAVGMFSVKLGQQAATLTANPDEIIRVTKVDFEKPAVLPEQKTAPPVTKNDPIDEPTQQFGEPEIVHANQATNVNLVNEPVGPETPEGTTGIVGNNPTSGSPGTGTTSGTGNTTAPDKSYITSALDELPKYPGGLDAFYTYVGKNFKRPDIEDAKKITVIVSFVIEKDGSLTEIKVLRDPGYGMAREAIRVLKASKEKWTAGIKNGQPVRTSYTLPITVSIE